MGLREFLVLGKGMTVHPAVPQSVLSDVLESLIAAIYLDGGIEPAQEFVLAYFGPEIESAASGDTGGNYKSLLQQFAQREHGVTPTYHLLDEKGPDHSKCFKMTAQIGPTRFPPAWGRRGVGCGRSPQRSGADVRAPPAVDGTRRDVAAHALNDGPGSRQAPSTPGEVTPANASGPRRARFAAWPSTSPRS